MSSHFPLYEKRHARVEILYLLIFHVLQGAMLIDIFVNTNGLPASTT